MEGIAIYVNTSAHPDGAGCALLALARCKSLLVKPGPVPIAGDGAGTKLPHVMLRYLMLSGMGQLNWLSYAIPR